MFCYVSSANFPFMPHEASLKGCYHWISINRNDSVFLRTPPKLSSVTRDNCVKKRKGQHEHLSVIILTSALFMEKSPMSIYLFFHTTKVRKRNSTIKRGEFMRAQTVNAFSLLHKRDRRFHWIKLKRSEFMKMAGI